ncbi:hypothetical protein EMIHUDRAFT_227759 [Emiliania huxleyi CCMP1516]|uniref:C2H2-type domain-containing protein n=2 Tax=Emiliania huxleyi TaxID=2903 RepID=A0A0D3KHG7_EMIH1|nr:hypothetical protein EMIHUDRAFT_227759 [Emiliania huxleyi CCMP1516]EOD35202.1 hypothetical protein EMIHUDRAFT_227759 [Emiliania huxleyi CCMP1516]|eukprot:XP_005787631.1 hypothetical protein EMIHUDRAFT_227759 [Emiliania huxleyi CCMP1516]
MARVFTQAASPLKLNLHAPKPASRFDDLSFDPMDASPLPARGLAAAGRGTKVILTDLRKHDDLNGEVGFIVFKPDDRFDGELRYRVLLRDHPDIVFAKGSNLLVDTTVDDHPIQSLLDCFKQKLGLTASIDGDITFRLSLLASLSPSAPSRTVSAQIWDAASFDHESDSAVVELAKIPDEQALVRPNSNADQLEASPLSFKNTENRCLWKNILPVKIKRKVSLLLDEGLLSWQDVLEDGNVFWEIAYTDTPDWPEPERWYQASRPPPSPSRSRRLGRELYPLYFPDEPEEARAAMAVRAKTLSDYEEERNRQARVSRVIENQQMLVKLGITTLDIRNERGEAEKKANERREQPSTSSAPTRASARQASADYNQPNYLAPAKPSRKAKAAKKAPTGGKAKAGGERKKKRVSTRGASASITPGGRGFVCINPDCDEASPHAPLAAWLQVKCLFDGCAKPWVKCQLRNSGSINLHHVRAHEALHTIGDPPRKGFVCPSCDSLHDTADAAWACAATHGVEHDNKRCLWDGCGETFRVPAAYKAHEPKHTGIWPYHCPTCGAGQKTKIEAERHCVIGSACVCGWVSYADRGKINNEKELATHLKRCRAEGGLATKDTLAVGQVKRRKLNEAE